MCFQAPAGELNVVANELKAEGSQNCHLEAASGLNLGGDGKVAIDGGSMLKVHGATTGLKASGVASPAEASDSCEAVPDKIGG